MVVCAVCGEDKPRTAFSKAQISKKSRKCKDCVATATPSYEHRVEGNFVSSAGVGCHIAHDHAEWLLAKQPLCMEEFGVEHKSELPDISIDPDSKLLTVINTADCPQCYFISLEDHACVGSHGRLQSGTWRDESLVTRSCTTFIVVLDPDTVADLCEVSSRDVRSISIHSDIQQYSPIPRLSPDSLASLSTHYSFSFPLLGPGPFKCTQGFHGRLTHFCHPSTCYAVDLECPIGTPVLAIANGTVVSVSDNHSSGGIHSANLFKWNGLTVRYSIECSSRCSVGCSGAREVFVDYVHIQPKSARVHPGQLVVQGHVLCLSGDIGFCPSPHLHLQVNLSGEAKSPSVPFQFRLDDQTHVIPEAGQSYIGVVSCATEEPSPILAPNENTKREAETPE